MWTTPAAEPITVLAIDADSLLAQVKDQKSLVDSVVNFADLHYSENRDEELRKQKPGAVVDELTITDIGGDRQVFSLSTKPWQQQCRWMSTLPS